MMTKENIATKPYLCKVCNITRLPDKGITCNKCNLRMKRWGTNTKVVTLIHLHHTALQVSNFRPSKELQLGLEYFTNREHDLVPQVGPLFLATKLLTAIVFAKRGWLEYGNNLNTYLIYLMTNRDNIYRLRDRKKYRYHLADRLMEFTFQVEDVPYKLFSLLLQEAERLDAYIQDKGIEITMTYDGKYTKPKEGYVSLEDYYKQKKKDATNNIDDLFSYSFDR